MDNQTGRELVVVGEQGVVPVGLEGSPEVVEGEWEEVPEPELEVTPKGAIAAERAGRAMRGAIGGVLTRVGSKIESPEPPGDDLSDLFEGPDMDKDNDVYIDDLVTVDEEDVFGDGGEDMSDLLEVPGEILDTPEGEDLSDVTGLGKPASRCAPPRRRVFVRKPPSGGLVGLQL